MFVMIDVFVIKGENETMTKELKGANIIPVENSPDEPTDITKYYDDINVKNKIIWFNRILFRRLNTDWRK